MLPQKELGNFWTFLCTTDSQNLVDKHSWMAAENYRDHKKSVPFLILYIHKNTHTNTRTHTHSHAHTYTHTRAHTQTHLHAHEHIHTHAHTHTHTHTHLFNKKLRSSLCTKSFLIFLLFSLLHFDCNQVLYFCCNQVESWVQVSYRGACYTKCVCICI